MDGYFYGSLSSGSQSVRSKGGADMFVAKLAGGNGSTLWMKSFGASEDDNGWVRQVEASGDLLLAAQLAGPVEFDTGTVIADRGALVRLSGTNGAFTGRLLPNLITVALQAVARHEPSGDSFILEDVGVVRRVRLRP